MAEEGIAIVFFDRIPHGLDVPQVLVDDYVDSYFMVEHLICSFLGGYRKVDAAMRDERIKTLVRNFMDLDFTPYVPAPADTNLEEYKQTLVERFANRMVSDQVARLCFDGASKFPVYVMPHLEEMITDDASGKRTDVELKRVAYLFATYRHYLKYKVDDNVIPLRWMIHGSQLRTGNSSRATMASTFSVYLPSLLSILRQLLTS